MPNAFMTLEIKGCTCNMMYNFCWKGRQSYIAPTLGVNELNHSVYEGNTKRLYEMQQVKENFVSQVWNDVCLIPPWKYLQNQLKNPNYKHSQF